MKFVTYKNKESLVESGWIENDYVYSMAKISKGELPDNMLDFLKSSKSNLKKLKELLKQGVLPTYHLNEVELLAPLPNPTSLRDFMAFESHIVNVSKNSGIALHPNWYEIPAFYFSNHHVIQGPEEIINIPPHCKKFDYELEIAVVIGKEGMNIPVEAAEEYIFGYTILNDWSARDLQMEEMKVGLGPAKGKDAATSIGPFIVTKDELDIYKIDNRYDLKMTAKVNGEQLSKGNFKDIYYTFHQMIERASDGVRLYPGDIIGSGTVGTGCLLELGSSWLKSGDKVELEIEALGVLRNMVK